MIHMKIADLPNILNVKKTNSDQIFKGVSIDSRNTVPNNLFVAIKGKRYDGHDYIKEAIDKGAIAAVVERFNPKLSIIQLVVADTMKALGALASNWRIKFQIPVIAITGSVGKTTVKEMIGSILSQLGSCLISQGNMNNEIGLPLTLFSIEKETKFVVVEMGATKNGDIDYLAKIAKPSIGIITCCAPAHLESFESLENIAITKGALVSNLPSDGTAVLNKEDRFFDYWKKINSSSNLISFGKGGDCFSSQELIDANSSLFQLNFQSFAGKLEIEQVGRHNINNALAAAATSFVLKADLSTIAKGLLETPKISGRLFWVRGKRLNILDDSYNANPRALSAAIDTLCYEKGEKWIVLGDMLELGSNAQDLHDKSVMKMNKAGIYRLFCLGCFSVKASRHFGKLSENFTDVDNLILRLKDLICTSENKVSVLIKGSRAFKLDQVVKALKEANV